MEDYSKLKGTEFKYFDLNDIEALCFLAEIDNLDLTVKGNWINDPENFSPIDFVCINHKEKLYKDEEHRKIFYDFVVESIKAGVYRSKEKPVPVNSDGLGIGACAFE